jgi:nucleoside phosphorylase
MSPRQAQHSHPPIEQDRSIVLIVPTRWETEAVLRVLPGARHEPGWKVPAWRAGRLLIVEPGMGPGTMAAVLPCLDALLPGAVWLFGWCGGLTPELKAGDLVLANLTIVEKEDGSVNCISHPPSDLLLAALRRLVEGLGLWIACGPMLSSHDVLRSEAQKRAAAATGALAVEMEAGPLACWAVGRPLPFVHVRVVLDPLGSALPSRDLPTNASDHPQKRAILVHALNHPREWPALWRLFRQARTARRVMSDVVAALSRPGGPWG